MPVGLRVPFTCGWPNLWVRTAGAHTDTFALQANQADTRQREPAVT